MLYDYESVWFGSRVVRFDSLGEFVVYHGNVIGSGSSRINALFILTNMTDLLHKSTLPSRWYNEKKDSKKWIIKWRTHSQQYTEMFMYTTWIEGRC